MLVKVTAWAPIPRTIARMHRALWEFRIRGVATNLRLDVTERSTGEEPSRIAGATNMSELRSRSSGSVTNSSADTTPSRATGFPVLDLDDARAQEPEVAGAKASALSRARVAKLPALPGFVVTTEGVRALVARDKSGAAMFAVHDKWRELSENGERSLVVRSSSPNEDGASQSMAGMFTSVLDVRGWPAFLDAVDAVACSGQGAPIAALVQPFLQPAWGGVLFGADPGDRALRPSRRCRSARRPRPIGVRRSRWRTARALAARSLARGERGHTRRAAKPEGAPTAGSACRPRRATFGGPQDIEWAIEANGSVVLLQSRPITALGDEARAAGPVFGPGPVAETFGLPLRPLEEDLWVAPLRDALREALTLAGATPARQLRGSPIVVDGRWARRSRSGPPRAHAASAVRAQEARPRPPARRLKAAWRVGRLKVASACPRRGPDRRHRR